MKKSGPLCLMLLAFSASHAYAQQIMPARQVPLSQEEEAPAPIESLPLPGFKPNPVPGAPGMPQARPAQQQQAQPQGEFPALPPSRPCQLKDILGIWRIISVYEDPRGQITLEFSRNPFSYRVFRVVHTFFNLNVRNEMPLAKLIEGVRDTSDQAWQYVIDNGGFVFLYNKGVAFDSRACFIVANDRPPFSVGQMLLMPPQGQSASRLVQVYNKLWSYPANELSAIP